MEWILICDYNPRCQTVVQGFVEESAKALGASQQEVYALGIAAEEAVVHILENVPAEMCTERFEVRCTVLADGIEFRFGNLGRPINLQALPEYNNDRPEESIEGLPFFLMSRMVDRFEFVNQGKEGWCTVIYKRLAGLGADAQMSKREEEADLSSRAAEKLQVRRAHADDAPAITQLAYQTYHYTYPRDIIYYPDRLSEALRKEEIVSFVALNPMGTLIGQMALFADPGCRKIAEIGALMVHPDYRRSRGLLHIIRSTQHFVTAADTSFDFFTTNQITEHLTAQRMSGLFHFHPMALRLSFFDGLVADSKSSSHGRINLLYLVYLPKPLGPIRLHVPARHASFARTLFAETSYEPDWEPVEESWHNQEPTRLGVHIQTEQAVGFLRISQSGPDLVDAVRRAVSQLLFEDLKTIYVTIPLWEPGGAVLDESADSMQLFFSGFVAESPERWALLYTRIIRPRLDFSRIEMLHPLAVALKEYVQSCYERAVPD